jgi:hypothetical protein
MTKLAELFGINTAATAQAMIGAMERETDALVARYQQCLTALIKAHAESSQTLYRIKTVMKVVPGRGAFQGEPFVYRAVEFTTDRRFDVQFQTGVWVSLPLDEGDDGAFNESLKALDSASL